MNMSLPAAVRYAMNALAGAGYQVYVVGGSVRDVLLHQEPHDFDLTTSALPEEMLALFSGDRLQLSGMKHGTVALIKYGAMVEMTTFRIDGAYTDLRHPDEIQFTGSLYEDVVRRDFTINALCWNPKTGLIDYVGGEEDIRARVVRCVGDPNRRFQEDALRILRALRFSATLDFDIEEETARAALRHRELIRQIAAERILAELLKLLCGTRAEQVLLSFRPVFEVFMPELEALGDDDYPLMARRVALTAPVPPLRMAAVMYGMDVDTVTACAQRLRMSRANRKFIEATASYADRPLPNDRPGMRRWLGDMGEELFSGMIELRTSHIKALTHMVIQQGDCVTIQQLAITGEDVFRAGVSRAKTGACLNVLLDRVISGTLKNEREALLSAISAMDMSGLAEVNRSRRRKRGS